MSAGFNAKLLKALAGLSEDWDFGEWLKGISAASEQWRNHSSQLGLARSYGDLKTKKPPQLSLRRLLSA
tara:strand:+ start:221 stop:427 length:207 start_codon:yes stop_codon:yes gene_type:complete